MGCGMAVAKNGWQLLVARYAPAGNIKGGYEDNVGDLLPEIYSGTVSQCISLFQAFSTTSLSQACYTCITSLSQACYTCMYLSGG